MNIPTPLFDRFVCHNNAVAAQVAGDVEDLESIGALPTLDGTIAWSFRGPSDTFDPEALFTFVIWRASLRLPLSRLLQDPRCEGPVVILYRGVETSAVDAGWSKDLPFAFCRVAAGCVAENDSALDRPNGL